MRYKTQIKKKKLPHRLVATERLVDSQRPILYFMSTKLRMFESIFTPNVNFDENKYFRTRKSNSNIKEVCRKVFSLVRSISFEDRRFSSTGARSTESISRRKRLFRDWISSDD